MHRVKKVCLKILTPVFNPGFQWHEATRHISTTPGWHVSPSQR